MQSDIYPLVQLASIGFGTHRAYSTFLNTSLSTALFAGSAATLCAAIAARAIYIRQPRENPTVEKTNRLILGLLASTTFLYGVRNGHIRPTGTLPLFGAETVLDGRLSSTFLAAASATFGAAALGYRHLAHRNTKKVVAFSSSILLSLFAGWQASSHLPNIQGAALGALVTSATAFSLAKLLRPILRTPEIMSNDPIQKLNMLGDISLIGFASATSFIAMQCFSDKPHIQTVGGLLGTAFAIATIGQNFVERRASLSKEIRSWVIDNHVVRYFQYKGENYYSVQTRDQKNTKIYRTKHSIEEIQTCELELRDGKPVLLPVLKRRDLGKYSLAVVQKGETLCWYITARDTHEVVEKKILPLTTDKNVNRQAVLAIANYAKLEGDKLTEFWQNHEIVQNPKSQELERKIAYVIFGGKWEPIPREVKVKPITRNSEIDPRVVVSPFYWGVTLIANDFERDYHSSIFIEGIKNGRKYLERWHLREEGILNESHEDGTGLHFILRSPVLKGPSKTFLEQIAVMRDQANNFDRGQFAMFGNLALWGLPNIPGLPPLRGGQHNCFTWARAHMRKLGGDMQTGFADYFLAYPPNHLLENSEFETNPYPGRFSNWNINHSTI